LRVFELRELFDAVTTLSSGMRVKGAGRLAIVSNGGGAGILAVDALEARGGRLAELAPETIAALNRTLPPAWSKADPVDIIGDAGPERYAAALEAVLADAAVDAVLAINCPTAVTDSTAAAEAVLKTMDGRHPRPTVLTAWLGETAPARARALFAAAKVPTHETPDEAARAFMHLLDHAANQRLLMQAPPLRTTAEPDLAAVRAVLDRARAAGRLVLGVVQSGEILKAYGVPVIATEAVATPAEAAAFAQRIGRPVALKIASPDVTHKSDVGGVALGLAPDSVEASAQAMLARVAAAAPKARLEGFMIQAMADRPGAHELIAGLASDATFGPVVLFGAGGTAVEVLADRAIGLPPLNEPLALDMIGRTRVARLLAGYRDRPPADVHAIAETLIRLAELASDFPEIAELDINPLLADEAGVLALDARIRVAEGPQPGPAICPYPSKLVRHLSIGSEHFTVRPVRPEDASLLIDLVAHTDAEDVRLRFRSGLRRLPDEWAARLSQLDYDREMAFAAEVNGEIFGVARLAADPKGESAEFALLVRSDHQHRGLGRALMQTLIDYAGARGLKELWGAIERGNHRMLSLAADLGFQRGPHEELALVRASLDLGQQGRQPIT
jgi:acetyltransferase